MLKSAQILRLVVLVVLSFRVVPADAAVGDLNDGSLREIARIARAISVVNSHLPDGKYLEYGLYIYRAAQRYRVEPAVLISITQQETAFRNDLPEGKAGELGICQIRKMWLKQPKFKAEFHRAKIKDLLTPAKNFLFAAWILRGLKEQPITRHTLPYWSYYNSVRFENRFKYFLAVNQYISSLRKHEDFFSERAVAAQSPSPGSVYPAPGARPSNGAYRNPMNNDSNRDLALARWTPSSMGEAGRHTAQKNQAQRWIPDALLKLERAQVARQSQVIGGAQAAPQNGLDARELLSKAKVQD